MRPYSHRRIRLGYRYTHIKWTLHVDSSPCMLVGDTMCRPCPSHNCHCSFISDATGSGDPTVVLDTGDKKTLIFVVGCYRRWS